MARVATADSIETPTSWVVAIAAHLFIAITMSGGMMVLLVALKPIAAEFGWPRQYPSLAYAMAMLSGGFGGIFLSRHTDRHGLDLPVFAAVFATTAGLLVMAWVGAVWQLFAVHVVLFGLIGPSAAFSFLVAVVTRWFDRNRGTAVAIVASGQSLAGVFGPLAASFALETVGWRMTYWYAALFVLVGALACSGIVRRRPPAPLRPAVPVAGATGGGERAGLKQTVLPRGALFALLGCCIFCCCIPMSLGMGHLVSHATDLGYSSLRAAQVLSLVMAVSVVSRLGTGWLADRIGGIAALLLTSATQALGVLMFALVQNLIGFYLAAIVYGLGTGGVLVNYALIVREFFPAGDAGHRIGMIYFFGTIGMSFGGWLGGLVFDHAGSYVPAFWLAFASNVLNLILGAVVLVSHWRARAAPALA